MSQEYKRLLEGARAATWKTAENLIPKMYDALRKEKPELSPREIRQRIETDCRKFWSKRTILKALPDEAKDHTKQQAGRLKRRIAPSGAAVPAAQKVVAVGAAGHSIIEDAEPENSEPDRENDFETTVSGREAAAFAEEEMTTKPLSRNIVPFEVSWTVKELRDYLQTICRKGGDGARAWFTIKVDVATGKMVDFHLGRKSPDYNDAPGQGG